MKKLLVIMLLATVGSGLSVYSADTTIKGMMEIIKEKYSVKFVYDSSLDLSKSYNKKQIEWKSLEHDLKIIFKGTDIKYEISGKYILLKKIKKYTLSGYIYQENGESVINATVWDMNTGTGTLSNEHGFFSITLTEGIHNIKFSCIGSGEHKETINIERNQSMNIKLKSDYRLDEVIVTGNLNSPLNTTQTGKVSLLTKDFAMGNSLMSSPDVVKKLQSLPGVASGTELISGLYVHGGNNDENLFLLDGTPLYQINHLGGLFSAFNTDIVKNIDFYKSGFPARYGGRLSSVVDVRTREGNMKEYHGTFSLGLIDGRIQFEGPIIKERTSFNIAMRRTWLDALTAPGFAIANTSRNDKINTRYAFHDINAKVTHIFSPKSIADISFYSGNDIMKVNNKFYSQDKEEVNINRFTLQWGNFTTALNWKYIFSNNMFANFTGVYTRNRSKFDYLSEEKLGYIGGPEGKISKKQNNHSTINDFGYRMEFDYRPNIWNHIRFGSNYMRHIFVPQNFYSKYDNTTNNELTSTIKSAYKSNEFTLYAEDDISIGKRLKLNGGVHYTMFTISGKKYHSVEPRAAMNFKLCNNASFKVSYTEMSQFMHQLSSTYLNLPTDYWVPSTKKITPMRSRQYAAGVYSRLPYNINLSIEGFYKTMDNLIEYDGSNMLNPSADRWEDDVRTGKGKAYGAEANINYSNGKTSVDASYTLSWSKRFFTDFYHSWYPDKFDNRHKFSINLNHKFNDRIDVFASWNYHSGNRMTIPSQKIESPVIPGTELPDEGMMVYEKPNNVSLPNYHRLDLGINFRKITQRGFERIWNISLYNAYCRMNPQYAIVEQKPNGRFVGKAYGIFPIIPSFSYTIKF